MTVTVRQGNTFLHAETDYLMHDYNYKIIAHGCNMQGVMGAGFAKQMRQNMPWAYNAYKKHIEEYKPSLMLGQIIPVKAFDENTIVFNCLTQNQIGPHASLTAIALCVKAMESYMRMLKNEDNPIYIPFIGCGIGGLDWTDVEKIFSESSLDFRAFWV
jgi:O-acetyl-ADP-ribose deacetylase (regulator of RNase III)